MHWTYVARWSCAWRLRTLEIQIHGHTTRYNFLVSIVYMYYECPSLDRSVCFFLWFFEAVIRWMIGQGTNLSLNPFDVSEDTCEQIGWITLGTRSLGCHPHKDWVSSYHIPHGTSPCSRITWSLCGRCNGTELQILLWIRSVILTMILVFLETQTEGIRQQDWRLYFGTICSREG